MRSVTIGFENITIAGKKARFFDENNGGIPAHFYGANGFPLGSYSMLFRELESKYSLSGLSLRPCWPEPGPTPKQTNWEMYANDLIAFLDQRITEPIVGIGHSQGATATIIAASKCPDLFSKIIVVEPASVSPFVSKLVRVVPPWFKKNFEPWKTALKKQDVWDNKLEFYEQCRANKAFRRLSDDALAEYAKYGLKKLDNGKVTLTFPKAWEVVNYGLPPYIINYVKKVKTPMHVLAGKPSMFLDEKVLDKWKAVSPNSSIIVRPEYGHLFPLEAPKVCAELMLD